MTAGHVATLSPLARFEHSVIERIWISTPMPGRAPESGSSALVRKEGPLVAAASGRCRPSGRCGTRTHDLSRVKAAL
jgi:hypothetical protein